MKRPKFIAENAPTEIIQQINVNYHNLIVQNWTNENLIESIPRTLAYEIAKPSTPEEIKKGVLAGDIQTMKWLRKTKEMIRVVQDAGS